VDKLRFIVRNGTARQSRFGLPEIWANYWRPRDKRFNACSRRCWRWVPMLVNVQSLTASGTYGLRRKLAAR